MDLKERIGLMAELGNYLLSRGNDWEDAQKSASVKNGWFSMDFIHHAVNNIVSEFLQKEKLEAWANHYHLDDNIEPKTIGIVMAGNLPLVGFHDFLSVFISGHKQKIKLSQKDDVLFTQIHRYLISQNKEVESLVQIVDRLTGCDAYIATGSNNTGNYFEHYFGKYPHIIRKNKTSVAVLSGDESPAEIESLTDDIHLYYGFGCRNITKIYVPKEYEFEPLVQSFNKYRHFEDNTKYKNNFDYQLSIVILNNQFYMTNGTTLLTENENIFSPPAHIHYSFYENKPELYDSLKQNKDIQCISGEGFMPFGAAQKPGLFDYADGIDTMQFLLSL